MNGVRIDGARRVEQSGAAGIERAFPIESPIAIEFNGIGYAVMMATPLDLEDFGAGFALCERIVASVDEIEAIEVKETSNGWLLKLEIAAVRQEAILERVRVRVSESSCGLCGIENLEQAMRPLPAVRTVAELAAAAVFRALDRLSALQPMNRATGGMHAAAYCRADGEIVLVREDVGRHTALDKLVGAAAYGGLRLGDGFVLVSSRCSYEMVEKAVLAGASALVAISTATTLAIDRARACGLALSVLARPDGFLQIE